MPLRPYYRLRAWRALPGLCLAGCQSRSVWLFHPRGAVAATEFHYTLIDFGIMMLIVGPLLVATAIILLKYRKGRQAHYDPHFKRSPILEVLMWAVPIATVGVLTYFSYQAVFLADPYDPTSIPRYLARHDKPAPTAGRSSHFAPYPGPKGRVVRGPVVQVDVITTDWQWVFIYPHSDVATVDRLVVPVNTPVHFRLTSATVVNDFFIPQLVGEIDIMPGMRTKLAMIAARTGYYRGYSANFSGGGFSWMGFSTLVVSRQAYRAWTHKIARSPRHLTYAAFNTIAAPTINLAERPAYFSHPQKGLFDHVIHRILTGRVYRTPLRMTENMTKPLVVKVIH